MTWSYRVMRRTYQPSGETFYELHEVYYNADGTVAAWTNDPASVMEDSVDALRVTLERMLRALDAPVLDYDATPAGFA